MNPCEDCVSGQPGCYTEGGSDNVTGTYLFVTGGYPSYQKTELVSINEEFTVPECLRNLSDHQNELFYAAGGALPEKG